MNAQFYPAPGLSGTYDDCLASLNRLPTDYVFRGSVLQYNADVWEKTGAIERSQIEGAVQAAGFDFVSATTNRGLVSSGRYNISVTFTSRSDRNSVNDVQGNIYNAVQSVGLVVASDTIAILSRPSVATICGANVLPGAPTGTPPADSPGPPASSETPQWLKDLELMLGVGTGTLLIGGAVVAFLLLRR